jgi:hypothetical protein
MAKKDYLKLTLSLKGELVEINIIFSGKFDVEKFTANPKNTS